MQGETVKARIISREGGLVWRVEDAWYSPCYGKKVKAAAVVAEVTGVSRVVIDLVPGTNG